MSEEKIRPPRHTGQSYECDGCGECFESLERLRQHEVDCKGDDFEMEPVA